MAEKKSLVLGCFLKQHGCPFARMDIMGHYPCNTLATHAVLDLNVSGCYSSLVTSQCQNLPSQWLSRRLSHAMDYSGVSTVTFK